jgi:hypothetical protein
VDVVDFRLVYSDKICAKMLVFQKKKAKLIFLLARKT